MAISRSIFRRCAALAVGMLLGVGLVPPAIAQELVNDIEKSGVAQDPVGSTTQVAEGGVVDWAIAYLNGSDVVQFDGLISDTATGATIVDGSVQQPPGWTPTVAEDGSSVQWSAPFVAPMGYSEATSAAASAPFSPGTGGGDGFVPLFGADGNIYFTYHHLSGTVQCVDPVTGQVCPGYPFSLRLPSVAGNPLVWVPGNAQSSTVIGNRLYLAGRLHNADVYGVGCWDLTTRAECADRPFLTLKPASVPGATNATVHPSFIHGPIVIGDRGYTWDSNMNVDCIDMTTWATCGAPYPVSMVEAATFPRLASTPFFGFETLDTRIFTRVAYGPSVEEGVNLGTQERVRCFDTATNASCAGWGTDGKLIASGAQHAYKPFIRYDTSGTPDALCSKSYPGSLGGCVSLADGSPVNDQGTRGIPTALFDALRDTANGVSGSIYSTKHPDLNRTIFGVYATNAEVCWDWSTNDFCLAAEPGGPGDLNYLDTTGDGYVGDLGRIRPGDFRTKEYGATYDAATKCWWALGDLNVLWSFDDAGNTPCVGNIVNATGSGGFAGSFCSTGVPEDLVWTEATVDKFDPADWNRYEVIVRVPGGAEIGRMDLKGGETSIDLSGVDPGVVDELEYQILAVVALDRTPLESRDTTPVVTLGWDTSTGIQFCYQTTAPADACAQPTVTNLAEISMAGEAAEDTSTQSFEVVPDPIGKCLEPQLELAKTAYGGHDSGGSCPGVDVAPVTAGGDVTWCFSVTNTGDTTLDSIEITDPDLQDAPITVPGPLAPDAVATVFVEGTAGSSDLTNTATVTGQVVDDAGVPIDGAPTPTDTDTAAYSIGTPAVRLDKTVSADGTCPGTEQVTVETGAEVTWCFTVTNTGEIPLRDIQVTDVDVTPTPIAVSALAPEESADVSVTVPATAGLENTAQVSAQPADSTGSPVDGAPAVNDTDTASLAVVSPAITLEKTVYAGHDGGTSCPGAESIALIDGVDGPVTWCFTVTNTGDVDLAEVTVTDTEIDGSPLTVGDLAVDATATIWVEGTGNGDLTNTADATGDPVDENGAPLEDVASPTASDTATLDGAAAASVGSFVFRDSDADGAADPDEPGLGGVTVTLTGTDVNGNPVSLTTVTADDGSYSFGDLLPDDGNGYTVTVDPTTLPDGLEPTTAFTDTVTVAEGASVTAARAGAIGTASLTGSVFHDVDVDGVDTGAGDPPLGGITVTLVGTDVNGDPVSLTTVTAEDGSYTFEGLVPSGPDGYTVTVDPATVPPALSETTTGLDQRVTVADGETARATPMGVWGPAVVSGSVWTDADADGELADGEARLGGVTVTLVGTDVNGDPVSLSTVTAEDGSYSFEGLVPSGPEGYQVTVDRSTLPDGAGLTTAGSYTVTPVSGDVITDRDFGVVQPVSLSGTVFSDPDADGVLADGETGLGGITVTLVGTDVNGDPVSLTTVTAEDGSYTFEGLVPSGPDGYTVTVDTTTLPEDHPLTTTPTRQVVQVGTDVTDIDFGAIEPAVVTGVLYGDDNGNGEQDGSEPVFPGVTVTLVGVDILGNPVSVTTVTDENGAFDFGPLLPSGPDGYTVNVAPEGLPEEYALTDGTFTQTVGAGESIRLPIPAVPAPVSPPPVPPTPSVPPSVPPTPSVPPSAGPPARGSTPSVVSSMRPAVLAATGFALAGVGLAGMVLVAAGAGLVARVRRREGAQE